MTTATAPPAFGGGRIPLSLQKIFMASNQGEEVYVPPTDNSAFKVFGGLSASDAKKPILFNYTSSVKRTFASVPPQAKFHMKLKERGYFPRNFASKRSGYYNLPTEHQLASYGSKILDVVKRNQVQEFRKMLEAGLSPNACNEHGESLLHMVCRHGKLELFNLLLAYDVDLQQTDDYGRTPMHDACWAANPSFDIAAGLMKRDPNFLFLFDARGSLPLSYVCKPLHGAWNDFLTESMDKYFATPNKNDTPVLCTLKPNSRPVPDPKNKIPAPLANAVANGEISPLEALAQLASREAEEDTSTVLMSEYDSEEEEESDYDSDDDDDSEFDDLDEELFEIVGHVDHLRLNTIDEVDN